MRFVGQKDLKIGMRLAKPIYTEEGVLLYTRDTPITASVLTALNNFNTYGQYILEPAEPLPPMSEEELEFERFTTVSCSNLKEDMLLMIDGKPPKNLDVLAATICNNYGKLQNKITFIHTLRCPNDAIYKHGLSSGILAALISNKLGIDKKDQECLVKVGLLHDLGKLLAPKEILSNTGQLSPDELKQVRHCELQGLQLIKDNYAINAGVRRYITQLHIALENKINHREADNTSILPGTKLLKVVDMFDTMCAMRVYKDPVSEFSAITYLLNNSSEFDEKIVMALCESIHILPVGCCVELTTGEKGLVISENEYYHLRPRVLVFSTNSIYDLGQKKVYEQIKIKDIMKTMDNRFVINPI
jgi:HD-GYP domain-containing protein (c-di-GMP phosphodiesterase class II)